MPVQQVTSVVCSSCGAQYSAPVQTIINGQEPAMKAAFLQGRVNLSQCPQCGAINSTKTPVLYYDLEKELAFVYTPGGISVADPTQEKLIGDLTNSLVNSLPPEQRKFYLFNPKPFLSLESMVKAILEADGITEEDIKRQETQAKLVQEFLQAPDKATLKEKVKEHDSELDYEFFELLTALMQSAQMEGDQEQAQAFFALRSVLGKWSSQGKEAIAEIDSKLGLVIVESQEQLLEKLLETKDDEELAQLVVAGHSLLDYSFFQKLTAKIDQAAKSGDEQTASTLKDLRTKVLDLKAEHEEASREALEQASQLLRDIVQSERPDKVIDKKLNEINEAFFFVLNAHVQEAQRRGQQETVQALNMIGNMVVAKLQGIDPSQGEPASSAEEKTEEQPQIHISRR